MAHLPNYCANGRVFDVISASQDLFFIDEVIECLAVCKSLAFAQGGPTRLFKLAGCGGAEQSLGHPVQTAQNDRQTISTFERIDHGRGLPR